MALSPGTRVGPYEVLAKVGEGGMGEVYRATDTKLKRQVALKILPPAFAADRDRLARFQREAEVLASLNHPNIAAIYGFEEGQAGQAETPACLVMELVEGPTLAEMLAGSGLSALGSGQGQKAKAQGLPLADALPIARQICDALEAAHEQGIIHRDLKPANIKIRPDGTVKVLDFGLAKAIEGQAGRADVTHSPTITTPAMTLAGVILGTAAYMSPEQAKGRPVDKRTDVWAFGAVLYEMLTGARAFSGDDTTEVIAAVLKDTPNWAALPADVPGPIVTLIQRCLEKDRKTRIGDIAVARFLLAEDVTRGAVRSGVGIAAPAAPRRGMRLLPWALAGTLLLTTAAVSFVHYRETAPTPPSIRFQVAAPENAAIEAFSLSPDGRHLVFNTRALGQSRLWLRSLDSVNAVALAGMDGATYPFWSPDSTQIGFFAQGKLKRIPVAGGLAVTVCDAVNGRGGSWNSDGVILFAPDVFGGLYRVAEAGGTPSPVTKVVGGNESDRLPQFLPDGQKFLFFRSGGKEAGVYGGTLSSGAGPRILTEATNAAYVAGASDDGGSGFILFRHENTLLAQPFDPVGLKTAGRVVPIADQVGLAGNVGYGAFSASRSGTIAYRPGMRGAAGQMVWLDRSGKRLGVISKPEEIQDLALSPDDKAVAFTIGDTTAGAADLWVHTLESGVQSKLTFGGIASGSPQWSPDGRHIAFSAKVSTGNYEIQQLPSTGGGRPEVLLTGPYNTIRVSDWSRDGKLIAFSSRSEKTRDDLWLLPTDGDRPSTGSGRPEQVEGRKAVVFLQTPANESNARFSPDGSWIAYQSNESGVPDVYVQHVPANGSKYQVSSGGGAFPLWSRDGKELFYGDPRGNLMVVPVTIGATFERGPARPLWSGIPIDGLVPAADGQRFLALVPAEGASQVQPITVVTNWRATLKN